MSKNNASRPKKHSGSQKKPRTPQVVYKPDDLFEKIFISDEQTGTQEWTGLYAANRSSAKDFLENLDDEAVLRFAFTKLELFGKNTSLEAVNARGKGQIKRMLGRSTAVTGPVYEFCCDGGSGCTYRVEFVRVSLPLNDGQEKNATFSIVINAFNKKSTNGKGIPKHIEGRSLSRLSSVEQNITLLRRT